MSGLAFPAMPLFDMLDFAILAALAQPLRQIISGTAAWTAFAAWATRW